MKRLRVFTALVACALTSCGAAQTPARTTGCVAATETADGVPIQIGHTVDLSPPCPEHPESYVTGPIRLTANEDGLRVQFEVVDPSFVAGSFQEGRDAGDAAVIFPQGEGPGMPVVELALDQTARGYRVDDVVPWQTWGLRSAEGAFHLVCGVFDREAGRVESEIRLSMHVVVRTAH